MTIVSPLARRSERVDKYDAAAILHCDPPTVVDMARAGRLPSPAKLTRERSFAVDALRDYVRRKETEAWQDAQKLHEGVTGAERRSMVVSPRHPLVS
jgi:hypothetical protein